jgi:hypothetical protein
VAGIALELVLLRRYRASRRDVADVAMLSMAIAALALRRNLEI